MARYILNCAEATQSFQDCIDQYKDFLANIEGKKTSQLWQEMSEIKALTREKVAKLEEYNITLRDQLAKRLEFDYVGEIYPNQNSRTLAWGIHNNNSRNPADKTYHLIDLTDINKPFASIKGYYLASEFCDGSAYVQEYDASTEVRYLYWINEKGEKKLQEVSNNGGEYYLKGRTSEYHIESNDGSPIRLERWLQDKSAVYGTGEYLENDGNIFATDPESEKLANIYRDGMTWATVNGILVIIDKHGKVLVELNDQSFDYVYAFSRGYALAFNKIGIDQHKVSIINKEGQITETDLIVDSDNALGRIFCDRKNFDGYYIATSDKNGFVFDETGKRLEIPIADNAQKPISVESGIVYLWIKGVDQRCCFYNIARKEMTEIFEVGTPYNNGYAFVQRNDGIWYILNQYFEISPVKTEGEEIEFFGDFSDGIATAHYKDGRCSYFNIQGKRITPIFDCKNAGSFISGIAKIDFKDDSGLESHIFIDRKGQRVFNIPQK